MEEKIQHECSACGRPGYVFADPCWDCVKARHRGVLNRRCTCPKALRRPKTMRSANRTWEACERCLAPIVARARRAA